MVVISDAKRARKVSILCLCVVLGIASAILFADLVMWWTIGGRSSESDFLIRNYIPFYISYYVVFMLECQYWHLVYCIERRLKLMNECLKTDGCTPEDVLRSVESKAFSIFRASANKHSPPVTPKTMGNVIDVLGSHNKLTDIFFIKNASKVRGMTTRDYITKLTRVYLKLCDAADYVNKCSGITILIILTSCLLHLVVTPYFLVLEVIGRRNLLFTTLQSVWLAAHIGRLIIIVEASYSCTLEAKKTRPLVCKLMCFDFDDSFKRQLEIFATELHHRQIEFTACGLVTIDRTLITTIVGAVTTYLVILIQFEKNNNG